MKVYLSVPMIAGRALERARLMADVIGRGGHEVTSPWVLGEIERAAGSGVNVFERDRLAAETSDVLVADVTAPSTGVGMEIMAAFKAGRRVVLVARKGSVLSRMVLHMEKKELVEFDDDRSLEEGLSAALGRS
ncbi:MAG: hypothetical protein JRN39_04180 [Nitrososphaerota archaeon]|nr:hypothetical protein [Nitrososphaerota archaeon]MDG6939582.1 hypothetical protein [Nitrososphaerota archaeon]